MSRLSLRVTASTKISPQPLLNPFVHVSRIEPTMFCVQQGVLFNSILSQAVHIINGLVATICMTVLHVALSIFWLKDKSNIFFCLCCVCFKLLRDRPTATTTMKRMSLPNPLDRLLAFLERGETQPVTLTF